MSLIRIPSPAHVSRPSRTLLEHTSTVRWNRSERAFSRSPQPRPDSDRYSTSPPSRGLITHLRGTWPGCARGTTASSPTRGTCSAVVPERGRCGPRPGGAASRPVHPSTRGDARHAVDTGCPECRVPQTLPKARRIVSRCHARYPRLTLTLGYSAVRWSIVPGSVASWTWAGHNRPRRAIPMLDEGGSARSRVFADGHAIRRAWARDSVQVRVLHSQHTCGRDKRPRSAIPLLGKRSATEITATGADGHARGRGRARHPEKLPKWHARGRDDGPGSAIPGLDERCPHGGPGSALSDGCALRGAGARHRKEIVVFSRVGAR